MKRVINMKNAAKAALIIYGLLVLFHAAIIIGAGLFSFIPINIVWGGTMETKEQLLEFEIISLLVVIFCLFLTMIKTGYIKIFFLKTIAHYSMWILFVLFLFSTIGNITAKTIFENSMAIISLSLSLLSLRLALGK